jgi:hypothetical protein
MGTTLMNLAQWLIKVNEWTKKIPAMGPGFKIS